MHTINRDHKDRLFSFLFGSESNKEWTLSLYNAVNNTSYTDPQAILFTTIEDAVYMGMKNDLSFILFHVMNIYGKRIVRLPIPKLVVFYNGTDQEDDQILELSDAFDPDASAVDPDIAVRVRMININYGHNKKLLRACQPLAEYAWLVEQVRKNRSHMDIEHAVDKAIDDMPGTYAIRPFLIGNRAEVKDMCITEYNEAETLQLIREEERAEGRAEGQLNLLARMVRSGDMSIAKAAQYAGMTIEQFRSYTS